MPGLKLRLCPGEYAICRLAPSDPVPAWAQAGEFSSSIRTAAELSLLCPAAQVPAVVRHERDWRLLQLQGPFPFTATGILAAVLAPLAAAQISILAQATFDTDYVLVRTPDLERAISELESAGHTVQRS